MVKKKNRLVEVEWEDSCAYRGWQITEQTEISMPSQCRSIGYLMVKDDDRIVIAQSLDDDGMSVADVIVIPKSAVKRLRNIKV